MAFEKPTHKCPTQFSETNFKYKKYSLTSTNIQFLREDQKSGRNY